MAGIDAKMAEYLQRFLLPIAAVIIGIRLIAIIYKKSTPRFFAYLCRQLSGKHHEAIQKHKEKLFAGISSLSQENKRCFALEIGCGTGSNFDMYPPNTSLIVVEPNEHFRTDVASNAAKFSSLEIADFLAMGAEDLKEHVADGSQDAVVSTLTLCSVQDLEAVVSEVFRVLKPGGHFYFIEHTEAHKKGCWSHIFQRLLAPTFYALTQCNLIANPWIAVERAGFSKVQYTKTQIGSVPNIFKWHVFGCAVK
ncbi:thiol S-methyltransferase TMT1A-like [Diadema antillarum]|uniref:thiol S-methyltransferase TMT1A-like n=1 Tax=Diadema antillarum TaxID=105358 RepID=UPI003A8ACC27